MRECGTFVSPEELTLNDRRHVELFRRFLRGDRDHEVLAWALGEPMTSANDPSGYGMGV